MAKKSTDKNPTVDNTNAIEKDAQKLESELTQTIIESTTADQPILKRANKITITTLADSKFQAKFYKTHNEVAVVNEGDTKFTRVPEQNTMLQREMFRLWVTEHSQDFGVMWDPTDRQQDAPPRKYATLDDMEDRALVVLNRVMGGIIDKLNSMTVYSGYGFSLSKESPIDFMQEDDAVAATYNDGSIRTATLMGIVTIREATTQQDVEIIVPVQLVSGQMKNPDSHVTGGMKSSLTATNLIAYMVATGKFPSLVREKSKDTSKPTDGADAE